MMDDERQLDEFFQEYRAACPEVEPSTNFMPVLWQKIEARSNFWSSFPRLARAVTTASAAICLLLLVLNLVSTPHYPHMLAPTYMDALMADHTAEETDYTEAIRNAPTDESPAAVPR